MKTPARMTLFATGMLAACSAPTLSLSELRASCAAGSATACAQATRLEEANRARLERAMSSPSPNAPGCQQGAEGEVTCI